MQETEQTAASLTERQRAVLTSIVLRYVGDCEPVGSRVLSKDLTEHISPATIRNVMSDMEEMGLIEQPHTSAGRLPTELGYRTWVEHVMPREPLSESDRTLLDQSIKDARDEQELLMAATLAMAEVTRLLGVAVAPVVERLRLDRLDLIPAGERQMVLIATFGTGLVRSLTIEFEGPLKSDSFAALAREVHLLAIGHSPEDLRQMLRQRLILPSGAPEISDLAARVLEALVNLSASSRREEVILQGATQIFSQPELGERAHLTDMVQLLEDRRLLAQILQERCGEDQVVVSIGSQNRIRQMRYLSLVSRTYRLGDAVGSIGVVGPTRMPYARLISIVDHLAQRLSQG
ncbi:MAG: heat-inducible transcription repressor HrcA [Fibrobacterota bacterium]|jgi:heat-inducible transcriptional repressor